MSNATSENQNASIFPRKVKAHQIPSHYKAVEVSRFCWQEYSRKLRIYHIEPQMPVKEFREIVCETLEMNPETTELVCCGDVLQDDKRICDYKQIFGPRTPENIHRVYIHEGNKHISASVSSPAYNAHDSSPSSPSTDDFAHLDSKEISMQTYQEQWKKLMESKLPLEHVYNNQQFKYLISHLDKFRCFTELMPNSGEEAEKSPLLKKIYENRQLLADAHQINHDELAFLSLEKKVCELESSLARINASETSAASKQFSNTYKKCMVDDLQKEKQQLQALLRRLEEKRTEFCIQLEQALDCDEVSDAAAAPISPADIGKVGKAELKMFINLVSKNPKLMIHGWKSEEMKTHLRKIANDPEMLRLCIPQSDFAENPPHIPTLQKVMLSFVDALSRSNFLDTVQNNVEELEELLARFLEDYEMNKELLESNPGNIYKVLEEISDQLPSTRSATSSSSTPSRNGTFSSSSSSDHHQLY